MAVQFEETHRYLDKTTLMILLVFLAATDVFVLFSYAMQWVTELWEPVGIILLSAVGAVAGCFMRLTVKIEDDVLSVSFVKTRTFPRKRILDAKKGDIDILRDYSGWGRGTKIKYRTYAVPGIDGAVSVKLGGKEVLTVTTERPDELYDIIYSLRRQD